MKRISLKYVLSILAVLLVNIIVIVLLTQYVGAKVKAEDSDTSESTSTGETTAVFSNLGSRGEEVRQIQTKLKELGYLQGNVDGIYGNQTKQAVTAFQRDHGLSADGIAGEKTLAALGIGANTNTDSGTNTGGNGSFTQSEVDLLARIISAEARGEEYVGQVAVGAVIMNRIEHPSFPNTLAGVIYQPGAFSCLYDGGVNHTVAESAYRAARDAINGWDPTGGDIYYYNPAKTSNQWMLSRPVLTVIGEHRFCA